MLDMNPETGRVILSLGRKPKPLINPAQNISPQSKQKLNLEADRQLSRVRSSHRKEKITLNHSCYIPIYSHEGAPRDSIPAARQLVAALERHAKGTTPRCGYEELMYRWPELFTHPANKRPLSKSAIKEIKSLAHLKHISGLREELDHYTTSLSYFHAVTEAGAVAYNTDGSAEPLAKCDRQRAEWALLAYDFLRRKERGERMPEREQPIEYSAGELITTLGNVLN